MFCGDICKRRVGLWHGRRRYLQGSCQAVAWTAAQYAKDVWLGMGPHLQLTCRYVAWTAAPSAMDVSACGLDYGTICHRRVGLCPGPRCHMQGTCRGVTRTLAPHVRNMSACGLNCGSFWRGRFGFCPGMQRQLQGTYRCVALTAAPAAMYVSAYGLDSGAFCKGLLGLWPGLRRYLQGTCRFVALIAAPFAMDVSACAQDCGVWPEMRWHLQMCRRLARSGGANCKGRVGLWPEQGAFCKGLISVCLGLQLYLQGRLRMLSGPRHHLQWTFPRVAWTGVLSPRGVSACVLGCDAIFKGCARVSVAGTATSFVVDMSVCGLDCVAICN
jgi:hypothetical protein